MIKVKLNKINITETIPIIIRQKEQVFNYPRNNVSERRIRGCCCKEDHYRIELTSRETYTKAGSYIKLEVTIDNDSANTLSPIAIELHKILTLKDSNNKTIRITKLVKAFQGKRITNSRRYQKKFDISISSNDYLNIHLNKSKAIKYFKHQEIIPYLFQSIKSENITWEFGVYAHSQIANITYDDLDVILNVLVYPIKEELSKSGVNISGPFTNEWIYKKTFLNKGNSKEKEGMKGIHEKKVIKNPNINIKNFKENEIPEKIIELEYKSPEKRLNRNILIL